MGNRAISSSFIIGLEIVSNDPLGSEPLLGESARPINNHRFFLKYKSIANSWIVGVKAKIDTEAGDHTRKYGIIHIFTVGELDFDCVHEISDRWVMSIKFKVSYDLIDIFNELFGLKEGLFIEEVSLYPNV